MVCIRRGLPAGGGGSVCRLDDASARQYACISLIVAVKRWSGGAKEAAPWLVKRRRELEIWAVVSSGNERCSDAAHALREQGIAHVVISLGRGAL